MNYPPSSSPITNINQPPSSPWATTEQQHATATWTLGKTKAKPIALGSRAGQPVLRYCHQRQRFEWHENFDKDRTEMKKIYEHLSDAIIWTSIRWIYQMLSSIQLFFYEACDESMVPSAIQLEGVTRCLMFSMLVTTFWKLGSQGSASDEICFTASCRAVSERPNLRGHRQRLPLGINPLAKVKPRRFRVRARTLQEAATPRMHAPKQWSHMI